MIAHLRAYKLSLIERESGYEAICEPYHAKGTTPGEAVDRLIAYMNGETFYQQGKMLIGINEQDAWEEIKSFPDDGKAKVVGRLKYKRRRDSTYGVEAKPGNNIRKQIKP